MTRLRSIASLCIRSCGLVAALLLLAALPAAAQSAADVIEEVKSRYQDQMDAIDTYVIETTESIAYHRKVTKDGETYYETKTETKGQGSMFAQAGSAMPTSSSDLRQMDRLAEHATHAGMETVNGRRSHVLRVDDPSKLMDPDDPQTASFDDVKSMTMYVDADMYVPNRVEIETRAQGRGGPANVVINMKDYRTVDGLTVAYTREFVTNAGQNMSAQQRQQMEQFEQQLKNMPPEQRKRMEQMMGDKMEQMKKMMAGEPSVVTVERVTVNETIPDGIFD